MQIAIEEIKAKFPVLKKVVHGKPLIYLDNGATTQKPSGNGCLLIVVVKKTGGAL